MADSGFSYDTLVASLSAVGAASGALISLSITGKENKIIPLVDYGDFSQHIFFTDAVRLFNTSFTIASIIGGGTALPICINCSLLSMVIHKSN